MLLTLNVATEVHKSDIRLGFIQTVESFFFFLFRGSSFLPSLQTMMDSVINW